MHTQAYVTEAEREISTIWAKKPTQILKKERKTKC